MRIAAAACSLLLLLAAARADAANVVVRFATVLGDFDVELCTELSDACPGVAPNTVANFLRYVDENVYTDTMFIHRRGAGGPSPLVIQGGGYWLNQSTGKVAAVPPFDPIDLELGGGLSNLYGTIAMARSGPPHPDPLNSATSQWFINLVNNVNLDTAGGGYAVFGKVVSGLAVVDAIGALEIWDAGGAFGELPLLDMFPNDGSPVIDYLVYVPSITRVPEPAASAASGAAAIALATLTRRRFA